MIITQYLVMVVRINARKSLITFVQKVIIYPIVNNVINHARVVQVYHRMSALSANRTMSYNQIISALIVH